MRLWCKLISWQCHMGHWWTFITLWPALSNPAPAQIVPKDRRSVQNPRDRLSLPISASPTLPQTHTQWEVDRPGWTEPSSGYSWAATATDITAHVWMFISACARHVFSNTLTSTFSRKRLKLVTNCKRRRTGWNSKKIFFLYHSVAFKCHLDVLQFIAVRSRTSISVIFLHFHILMTYSDCAFLKPFCKCSWLTDVHLRSQALSLRVWLALFAEFTESLYLNSPGLANGIMRCLKTWETFKHWKLEAHCREVMFLASFSVKISKDPRNEINSPEKQNCIILYI